MVSEATSNIRTVAAFNLQNSLEKKFQEVLEQEVAEDIRQNYINAVMLGLMDGIFCMLYATTILVASYYISWGWLDVAVVMPILYTLMQSLPAASGALSGYSWRHRGATKLSSMYSTP